MAAELKGWMEIDERAAWAGDEKIPLSFSPSMLAGQHPSVQLGCSRESVLTAGSDGAELERHVQSLSSIAQFTVSLMSRSGDVYPVSRSFFAGPTVGGRPDEEDQIWL